MTLVMAEKDQPVFRDFLGLSHRDETKQVEYIPSDAGRRSRGNTAFAPKGEGGAFADRGSSPGTSGLHETFSAPGFVSPPFGLAAPSSSDPGSVGSNNSCPLPSRIHFGWQRGKTAPIQHPGTKSAFFKPDFDSSKCPQSRESLQERLQMSVEAIENSRPQKVARFEQQRGDKRTDYREAAPSMDELRLSMQPPRPASNNSPWMPQLVPDIPRLSKRASPRGLHINTGVHLPQQIPQQMSQFMGQQVGQQPARISHLGACAEREERLAIASRENTLVPPISRPAADEGSRTGLKGSPLAGLINTSAAPTPAESSGPPPTPRPKNSSWSGGSDSHLPSLRQGPPLASRQLTIFYGGQAHVFDDIPPDKAEAIMALAGSNGRSWSTTCSPKPSASVLNSASEGSLSELERERDKAVQSMHSRGGSVIGEGNLALSSEVQTLLRGLAQSGIGTGRSI